MLWNKNLDTEEAVQVSGRFRDSEICLSMIQRLPFSVLYLESIVWTIWGLLLCSNITGPNECWTHKKPWEWPQRCCKMTRSLNGSDSVWWDCMLHVNLSRKNIEFSFETRLDWFCFSLVFKSRLNRYLHKHAHCCIILWYGVAMFGMF